MMKIIEQKAIDGNISPIWRKIFSKREYEYLIHVINGLIIYNGDQLDNIWIQYGETEHSRVLHIFEPFKVLSKNNIPHKYDNMLRSA
ncbi:MAG: hypothetical protein R2941_04515 [Desulfobacterales bacterium]